MHLERNHAILVCAILYFGVTGGGLMIEGYNFDDWRHLGATPHLWAEAEGRWAMDILYRYILNERFHLPLQITLAFFCLSWISYQVAKYAVDDKDVPLATVFVFLLGVNHVYMCDALTFNSHILAYPLAMALSLAAFHLLFLKRRDAGPLQKIGWTLLAGQILAMSLAIYQTYALFGLIIPGLVILLVDRYTMKAELTFLLMCIATGVIALILYQVEWQLYLTLQDRTIETIRFEPPTIGDYVGKILALPHFLKTIYLSALTPVPFFVKAMSGMLLVITMAAAGAAGLAAFLTRRSPIPARLFDVARIGLASAGLLLVLPVLFWFLYRGQYTPARTVAFVGFWTPALLLASSALIRRLTDGASWTDVSQKVIVTALILITATTILTASSLWSDRARIFETDKNVAQAVFSRVNSLEGYNGGEFRVVGGVDYTNFSWGGQIGWTTLHAPNPNLGIFKGMFNLPETVASYAISPQNCSAMPSGKSAFVHEGIAYVCLESKQAFLPLTTCVEVNTDGIYKVCLKDGMIFHVTPTCDDEMGLGRLLFIEQLDGEGNSVRTARLEEKTTGLELSDACYFSMRDTRESYEYVDIGIFEFGTGVVWTRRYARAQFGLK